MAYASVRDCIDRRGAAEIALLADSKGSSKYEALEKALDDASEEIDAYLAARHELPLDPVPLLLKRLCAEIGVYRRSKRASTRTEEDRQRYEDAIRLLKDISAGRASLGAADPDPPAEAEGPAVSLAAGPERVMDRDSLGRIL